MDEQLLAYFWGEDWKGEYPQWEQYTDEQKADFTRLKSLLATEYDRGVKDGRKRDPDDRMTFEIIADIAAPDTDIEEIHKATDAVEAIVEAWYDRGKVDGAIEEVEWMICNRHYGEGYAEFFTEYANDRRAKLLKSKGEV